MIRRFRVKRLKDGRAMLNCACGTQMNREWNNIDFGPYALLARHPRLARALRRIRFISDLRYERLLRVDPAVIKWDVRKGIPFDKDAFDVVYHSHFLEHLDRDVGLAFMKECYRVLKPEGTIRVVVPDLESLVKRYLFTLSNLEGHASCDDCCAVRTEHIQSIHHIFDQIVWRELPGTSQQAPWIRRIERLIRASPAKAGEIHRWMYDRFSLSELLKRVGFRDICVEEACKSRIDGWNDFDLDTLEDGSVHKEGSIYMEAVK